MQFLQDNLDLRYFIGEATLGTITLTIRLGPGKWIGEILDNIPISEGFFGIPPVLCQITYYAVFTRQSRPSVFYRRSNSRDDNANNKTRTREMDRRNIR
ncbi:unnamed protein product [Gordionus sp. m RMFG-2023]